MSTPLIFEPGGFPWIPWPHISIRGAGKEVMEALMRLGRNRCELRIADSVLARFLGRSIRYVQKGLKALETKGLITRIRELQEHGFCRTILIKIRVATSNRYKKNANDLGAKKFGRPRARMGAMQAHDGACSSSFEEVNKKRQQAPGGGDPDGSGPPPGSGSGDPESEAPSSPESEALAAADPLAVMMAAAGGLPAPEPATPPEPRQETPARRPTAAEALAERKRRAEPLARSGDKAAIAEMAEIERAEIALANRGPAPPSTPPPVKVEPPQSDPPPTLWEKLTPWSRKKRE